MKLLTVSEVAEILRLGESTVYELVSKGKIAGFRIGPASGGIRIAQDDLDAYLTSSRIDHKGETPRKVSRPRLKHIKVSRGFIADRHVSSGKKLDSCDATSAHKEI